MTRRIRCFVDIVAAEMRIAAGGEHFEDSFAQFEDGNVERSAAEIVNRDGALLLLVQAIRQRSGGRFIDDAQHIEAGNAAGIFGGLALRIIEICGNGDDRVDDFFAQCRFRILFQFAENERGKFGRRVVAAENLQSDDVFAVAAKHRREAAEDLRGHLQCLCP